MNFLRSCGGCSAHIVTVDATTPTIFCTACRPKHVVPHREWAAALKPGDTVFVQPYAAWRRLSHSRYLIVERDGYEVTLQVVGVPESRITTTIAHLGQHDMTPRGLRGALS